MALGVRLVGTVHVLFLHVHAVSSRYSKFRKQLLDTQSGGRVLLLLFWFFIKDRMEWVPLLGQRSRNSMMK